MSNPIAVRNNVKVFDNLADYDKVVKRVGKKDVESGIYEIKEIDTLRKSYRFNSNHYIRVHGVFTEGRYIGFASRMSNGNMKLSWGMQDQTPPRFEFV